MKKINSIFILILPIWLNAQEADTTLIKDIQSMQQQIDTLRKTIREMEKDMQEIKQIMVEGNSNIDEMLTFFGIEDVESTSNEIRSRYKRVSNLLKASQQRPGQLILNGSVTAISQFSANDQNFFGTGSFDFFATTSFGKGTLLFIDMEAVGGKGPDLIYPTFSGLNGDADPLPPPDNIDRLYVLEAWGEFTIFNEIITVTAGKIDITNYFDNNASANDETTQFISGSFINSTSFAVPPNSTGIRLRTTLLKRYHFQFGIVSQPNTGAKLLTNLYKIGSLGWKLAPDSDFESNIRLHGYQVSNDTDSYGFGVSFDKILFSKYNIFGRYGFNQDILANNWGVKSSWSAGFRFVKSIKMQPLVVGVAYGENNPYDGRLENEKLAELYILRQLNKWIHLSPHFQFLWNMNGANQDRTIIGIRTHFNF